MIQVGDHKAYSVTEVNFFAKQTLEQMELWVMGEITSFKQNPNWRFYYLDLKDESAILPCVADGSVFKEMGGDLTGQKILAFGHLSLYEPRGQYQFKIVRVEAFGEGVLQKQLEELIKKLKAEGLFDIEHKKEIPAYPKKVCIVTSDGSDAWNDFKRHTVDKFPIIQLSTADVRVQGSKSIPQLLEVLPKVDAKGFDVIVLTRGGGSLEDLAAFNDEQIARAIYKMKTPIVVAIGHEANESLAEWVADRRASTPTDAASIVTAGYTQLEEKLEKYLMKLKAHFNYYFSANYQRLDGNYRHLLHMRSYFKDLPHMLVTFKQQFDYQKKFRIAGAMEKIEQMKEEMTKGSWENQKYKKQNLDQLGKSLVILSPENVLSRGYSIAIGQNGKILRSINSVGIGETIAVKLRDGKITSIVKSKNA